MGSDESVLFPAKRIDATAADGDVDSSTLRTAAETHQSAVEELPGIENIVYEWRKHHEDPLIERTETAYYLQLPSQVWQEFGDALDLDDETLVALRDLHRRTVADSCDVSATPPDGTVYLALDRTW